CITPSSSLRERALHDDWVASKLSHSHSDSAQFSMVFSKLCAASLGLVSTHQQLVETVVEMRRGGDELRVLCEEVGVEVLRGVVESIPRKIRELAGRLEKENGIIVKGEAVRVTTEFLLRLREGVKGAEDV